MTIVLALPCRAADEITLLPPSDAQGGPCGALSMGVLQWDGGSPVTCIPLFRGDVGSGDVSASREVSVGGSTGFNGMVAIRQGLGIDGGLAADNGAVSFETASPVTIESLGSQCPQGGNLGVASDGSLLCCPAGTIVKDGKGGTACADP